MKTVIDRIDSVKGRPYSMLWVCGKMPVLFETATMLLEQDRWERVIEKYIKQN